MRRGCTVLAFGLLAGACAFDGKGTATIDGDPAAPDAPIDAPPGSPDAPVDGRADARLPDASPPDAAFSVEMCPADYLLTVGSSPGSRYRFIGTGTTFATHHADCNDDHNGWTHLVAIDDAAEADAIGLFNFTNYSYVGAVQQPGQTELDGNWFIFTGGPVTAPWADNQPNDANNIEDGRESLMVIEGDGRLHDVRGLSDYEAVCECDGRPVDPTVATYIP
jgi:hypothetical protein